MLKKFLITIVAVLTMISNANAVVIVPNTRSSHNNEIARMNNTIIGKEYHGCKIVDAFYSEGYYTIICLKSGQLYKAAYKLKRFKDDDCNVFTCDKYSNDIPTLFEENVNE